MKKILVVEDDPASLMLITEILKGYDYTVVSALDGRSALDVSKRENPDLIILDVMLPALNGYQVCERLRSMSQFRNTPIIMLTVLNEDSQRIRALEAGANGFLSKPFKRVELLTRIKALLSAQVNSDEMVSLNTVISSMLTALELRCAGSTMSSRRCADLAERLAVVMGIPSGNVRDLRRGLLLRDIGYVACNDASVAVENNFTAHSEHAIRSLQIVGAFGHEIIDAVVRYHHCTLQSEDYPANLNTEVLACVKVAIVCTRLEGLLYGNEGLSVQAACATLTNEVSAGLLPSEEVAFVTRLIST
ncbi:response regulator transcription factor [Olsenella uli]